MPLAAGTYGAVKAYVEAQGLALVVYKDAAPPQAKLPYCTVIEDIANAATARDDGGSAQGGTTYVAELAQLDLWMSWRGKDGKSLENRTLGAALHRKLDGCLLDLAPTRVYKAYVQNKVRMVERDTNLVHVAFTLAIRKAL
jgi:hypothetical protein